MWVPVAGFSATTEISTGPYTLDPGDKLLEKSFTPLIQDTLTNAGP